MKKTDIFKKVTLMFHTIGGLVFLCSLLLTTSITAICVSCYSNKRIVKYVQYYRATEILLDSLESNFNWIDAYDPGPAYDNYINARKEVRYER